MVAKLPAHLESKVWLAEVLPERARERREPAPVLHVVGFRRSPSACLEAVLVSDDFASANRVRQSQLARLAGLASVLSSLEKCDETFEFWSEVLYLQQSCDCSLLQVDTVRERVSC